MCKSMRAFCLLSALGLVAGSIWLYMQGLKSGSFMAACMIYILGWVALTGEVFTPISTALPLRPYKGESRSELIRWDLEDIQKAYPDSKWPARHSAVQSALQLGLLAWVALLAMIFPW